MFFGNRGGIRWGVDEVICMYEDILIKNGIEIPLTEKSFETLYNRYRQLGGNTKFYWDTTKREGHECQTERLRNVNKNVNGSIKSYEN